MTTTITIPPRVHVTPGEVTCLRCGETFPATWSGCPRCTEGLAERTGWGSRYRNTPTVPTISYLRDGEYDAL